MRTFSNVPAYETVHVAFENAYWGTSLMPEIRIGDVRCEMDLYVKGFRENGEKQSLKN